MLRIRRHNVERSRLRGGVVIQEVPHQARNLRTHELGHERLGSGQVSQGQLHRVADGDVQPRLAILRETKAGGIGPLADYVILNRLEIGLEDVKRVSAQPRLGTTDPTVLPNSVGVAEKRPPAPE